MLSSYYRSINIFISILVFTFITIIGAYVYIHSQNVTIDGKKADYRLLTEGIARAVKPFLITRNYAEIESILKLSLSNSAILSAVISDNDGKVLSYLQRTPDGSSVEPLYSVPKITIPINRTSMDDDENTLIFWHQIPMMNPLGILRLEFSSSDNRLNFSDIVNKMATIILSTFFILIFMIFLIFRKVKSNFLKDISEIVDTNSQDQLTGLFNRRALLERLEQGISASINQHTYLAICYMDLDGFKLANDKYGHVIGDGVLLEVSNRLRRLFRHNDTISRFGGDEFVIVIADLINASDCKPLLDRVLTSLCEPIIVKDIKLNITASVGVTIFPDDRSDAQQLLDNADKALYQVKKSGKNNWRFFSQPNSQDLAP
jgi:diguanylate cyclase (GGDEF)-like protein